MANTTKISRSTIVRTIAGSTEVQALLLAAMNENAPEGTEYTQEAFDTTMEKWMKALNKERKSTAGKDDDYIRDTIVPWVLSQDTPPTAGDLNKALIGAPRGNKASALLKRAVDLGLLARDKARKNHPFVYAAPDFDFEAYIEAYNEQVRAKQNARVEKASENRTN